MRYQLSGLLFAGFVMFCVSAVLSEDKPEPPRIALVSPFAILPNAATKVLMRGWKLNRDIEVKTSVPDVTVKVLRHDNATAPTGQDVKQVGDSLVELEVTLPQGFSADVVALTLVAGGVESAPYALLVGGRYPIVAEVEPNDSFRQAQLLAVPQVVDGQIHADRNVDVYAVELAAEHRLIVEIIARRQGSGLDSLLTLFNDKKQIVMTSDDADGADSKIDMMLPAGRYYLVVQDAHDHGGVTHPYRLIIQP